jgi:hypothetical protein
MHDAPRHNGPHDLGGIPAGAVDRAEHELTFWEQRVDALVYLMTDPKRGLFPDFSPMRRQIECLTPEDYTRLSYYERWAAALKGALVELGLLTEAEIAAKMAEIKARATRP